MQSPKAPPRRPGPVAQRIEHLIPNQGVAGSSPAGVASAISMSIPSFAFRRRMVAERGWNNDQARLDTLHFQIGLRTCFGSKRSRVSSPASTTNPDPFFIWPDVHGQNIVRGCYRHSCSHLPPSSRSMGCRAELGAPRVVPACDANGLTYHNSPNALGPTSYSAGDFGAVVYSDQTMMLGRPGHSAGQRCGSTLSVNALAPCEELLIVLVVNEALSCGRDATLISRDCGCVSLFSSQISPGAAHAIVQSAARSVESSASSSTSALRGSR